MKANVYYFVLKDHIKNNFRVQEHNALIRSPGIVSANRLDRAAQK